MSKVQALLVRPFDSATRTKVYAVPCDLPPGSQVVIALEGNTPKLYFLTPDHEAQPTS